MYYYFLDQNDTGLRSKVLRDDGIIVEFTECATSEKNFTGDEFKRVAVSESKRVTEVAGQPVNEDKYDQWGFHCY